MVIAEETAAGTEQVASSATELSAGMNNYNERFISMAGIAKTLEESLARFRLVETTYNEDEEIAADVDLVELRVAINPDERSYLDEASSGV